MEESDGCGEDHEKKKMGEGGYINNSPRGSSANQESVKTEHKPQFTFQTAANARGQSVSGKGGPPVWRVGSLLPRFQRDSRNSAFQDSICWCVYGV